MSDPRWRTRPFGADTSARGVIAECMTLRWAAESRDRPRLPEIPPKIWADAGAVVKALRAEGFVLRRDAVPRNLP